MPKRTIPFAALPAVPQVGLQPWQVSFYGAVKENLELLTGTRTKEAIGSAVVTHASITVPAVPKMKMVQLTAKGAGVVVANQSVPSLDDYHALIKDVNTLAGDVATLRETVNALLTQLKG